MNNFLFQIKVINSGAYSTGHFVRPNWAFTSQNPKSNGHLSDDKLLFAGLCLQL